MPVFSERVKIKWDIDKKWNNSLNAKVASYRNQSIDLLSRSIDWFLYDVNFGV